jgi:multisubunit Na+/H+ antiporter MnhB subunit
VRLSRRHQASIYGTAGLLFASGVLWLALHFIWAPSDEFGVGRSPLEAWCLRIHGLATMLMLAAVGALVPIHIGRAWELRRNRLSGGAMVGAFVTLALTGYMLYYAGDETLRPYISAIHWAVGLVGLPALVWHVIAGRRLAARNLRLLHPATVGLRRPSQGTHKEDRRRERQRGGK